MTQLPTSLQFDGWVGHIFDHPVTVPIGYLGFSPPDWNGPRLLALHYLTQLFEDPVPPLAPYSDWQINQGLWYLVGNGNSDYIYVLTERALPLPERVRCLRSFESLFRKLFAVRCSPHLSSQNDPGESPLNSICYMWWDVIPFPASAHDDEKSELDAAAIEVMAQILAINSIPCQGSALHGLGHSCTTGTSAKVKAVIDRFLRDNPTSPPELLKYARQARSGRVL